MLNASARENGVIQKVICLLIFGGLGIGTIVPMGVQAQPENLNSERLCPADLPLLMESWLDQSALQSATVGIAVETLTGEPIYHYQADRRLIPASTQKLLTTAAALQTWPRDRAWVTPVELRLTSQGKPELWIVGQGDPTVTDADLADLAFTLAQALKNQGIDRLDRLVGDDRAFGGSSTPPTWEVGDIQAGYGAPINSLILNDNAIGLTLWPQDQGSPLRVEWENPEEAAGWSIENFSVTGASNASEWVQVGQQANSSILQVEGVLRAGAAPEPVSIAVPRPGDRFLAQLAAALQRQGISIGERVWIESPGQAPPPMEPPLSPLVIATLTSPPLGELVQMTHYQSQNLYAEVLLRWLGQANPPIAVADAGMRPSALEAGAARVTQILEDWGIPSSQFTIADGSGLSRHNALTPLALVQVLQASARSSWGETYRSSLAQAGVSGNLAQRFEDTPLSGKLWGKTGSMEGIAALSGYLYPDRFAPLVFSVIINHSDASYGTLTEAIDGALLSFVQLQPCRANTPFR